MFKIQNPYGTYRPTAYATEEAAIARLCRLKLVGAAVVWFNDAGVPKVWVARWTDAGLHRT